MERIKLKDRILPKYTKGEEIFNMTSHIVGAVLRSSCNSIMCCICCYKWKCIWNCKWFNLWIYNDSIIHNV